MLATMFLLRWIPRLFRLAADVDDAASLVVWLIGDAAVSSAAAYGMGLWAYAWQLPPPIIASAGLSGFTAVFATIISVFFVLRTRVRRGTLTESEESSLRAMKQRVAIIAESIVYWWPDKKIDAQNNFHRLQQQQSVIWYDKQSRELMREFLTCCEIVLRSGQMPADEKKKSELLDRITQTAESLGATIDSRLRGRRSNREESNVAR